MEAQTTTPTTSATPPPAAVSTPTSGATTTTTSTAPTPAERPKTFAEAFANDAALQQTDATTQPEGATTPPVDGTDPQSATPLSTKAEPPAEKWPQILENARAKATQEATAAFDRDYGWAKQVPRESLERFGQIAGQMTSDPIGFLNRFVAELQANPVHAAQLRSNAGRMLAAKQANAEPPPDVQIVDANGQVTGTTYSAAQLAKRDAWNKAQLMADVQKEFGPLKVERDQQIRQQAADKKAADEKRALDAVIDDRISQVTDHLGIDSSTPAPERDAMLKHVFALMDADPRLSAPRAAAQVARQLAQGKVLETLKTKANAQAVNPAGAVVAATSRPKSFLDKSLKW